MSTENDSVLIGLCGRCRHSAQIVSARGSVFYLCERSTTDPGYPRYPRLPVIQCRGFEPINTSPSEGDHVPPA